MYNNGLLWKMWEPTHLELQKLTCNLFFGAKIEPFCGHHKKEFKKIQKLMWFLETIVTIFFKNEINPSLVFSNILGKLPMWSFYACFV
jgi:hypothetical protein